MTDAVADSLTPDEAFALVGHETRIAILRAAMDATREADDPNAPVSFSELRERAGVRDSGQFNYHLGKLVGPFLDHDEEGYRLRYTTLLVMGAVLAGTYTEYGSADPVAVGTPCPACGGVVEATYEDERAAVACTDCGESFSSSSLPPGTLEGYDPADYPDLFERWTGSLMGVIRRGFCIACHGRVDPRLALREGEPDGNGERDGDGSGDDLTVRYDCRRCPERATSSLGAALLDHPTVVAFHWEHGIDVREANSWELPWLHDDHAVVTGEDPLRVECTATLGDESLTLTVDEELEVIETVRS
jgi:hypothetical protein